MKCGFRALALMCFCRNAWNIDPSNALNIDPPLIGYSKSYLVVKSFDLLPFPHVVELCLKR